MTKESGIITISCFVLVFVVVAITVTVLRSAQEFENDEAMAAAAEEEKRLAQSKKFLKKLCGPTDYEKACEENLKDANTTDPKELVKLGLEATINHLENVIKDSDKIKDYASDKMSKQAVDNCKELLELSIDDLTKCVDKVENYEPSKIDGYLEDLDIWLSASLTFQETCLDGFTNTSGEAGEKMRESLDLSLELTDNDIAMVEEMANMFEASNVKALAGRRRLLLARSPPPWVARRLLLDIGDIKPNVVVAKDGSGKYKTINGALADIPKNSTEDFVIYVKQGKYEERVVFTMDMDNVVLVGDGPNKTRITGKSNYRDGVQTFKTPTVVVIGNYFFGKDIGFENTAGSAKGPAVALRVHSDKSVFFNCKIEGFEDTLHAIAHRQFYRDCSISGTVDFIFGNAAVIFQNCLLLVRKPQTGQNCTVTSQGRINKREPTGTILHNCTISPSPQLQANRDKHKVYLGRPAKAHSRTIIIQSKISDIVDPAGWTASDFEQSVWYGEHGNRGGGAPTTQRVGWKGYKALTAPHALDFTAHKFLLGDTWVPQTGIPYVGGWMKID